MKAENHPVKASGSAAALVAVVITLLPISIKQHESFSYIVSLFTAIIVWVQNWLWINGRNLIGECKSAFSGWRLRSRLQAALNDPHLDEGDKGKIRSEYSAKVASGLIRDINKLKDSL